MQSALDTALLKLAQSGHVLNIVVSISLSVLAIAMLVLICLVWQLHRESKR